MSVGITLTSNHVNTGGRPAFLFSFSDAPVMKALGLNREQTRTEA